MKRATWARFAVVALAVVAVIAAFAGVMYLRYSDDAIRQPVHTETCPGVVVAVRDIPAGTMIEPDMVTTRGLAEDQLAPYTYDDPGKVVGQVAAFYIASGEQVVSSKVAPISPIGLGISGPQAPRPGPNVGFGY